MTLDGVVFVHDDPGMWAHGAGRAVVSLAPSVPVLLVWPVGARMLSWVRDRWSLAGVLWRETIGSTLSRVEDAALLHVPMPPSSGWFRPLGPANTAWLAARIRKTVARLGWQRFGLWFTYPAFGSLIGRLGEVLRIYHAVDDYTTFPIPDADRQRLRQTEIEILKRVDLAFGVSRLLTEQMRELGAGPRAFHVPNGTNITMRRWRDCPQPADLGGLRRPLLCYLGALNERLDLTLLSQVLGGRPEWSLVIIGDFKGGRLPSDAPRMKGLLHLPNVYTLGSKPNAMVPDYLVWMDVCLIPYDVALAMNRSCFPYKLFDYLGAGRPVVSTPVPAVCDYAGHVRIAATPDEFERQIVSALEEGPIEEEARLRLAAANTWEARRAQILRLLEQKLAERLSDAAI